MRSFFRRFRRCCERTHWWCPPRAVLWLLRSGPLPSAAENFQPETKLQFVDGDKPYSAETGLQTILTAVSVGNITITCGPSSFLVGTNEHKLKLKALLVKNVIVECLECYLCVPYTVFYVVFELALIVHVELNVAVCVRQR